MTDLWMNEAEKLMMNALGRPWRPTAEALAAAIRRREDKP